MESNLQASNSSDRDDSELCTGMSARRQRHDERMNARASFRVWVGIRLLQLNGIRLIDRDAFRIEAFERDGSSL